MRAKASDLEAKENLEAEGGLEPPLPELFLLKRPIALQHELE